MAGKLTVDGPVDPTYVQFVYQSTPPPAEPNTASIFFDTTGNPKYINASGIVTDFTGSTGTPGDLFNTSFTYNFGPTGPVPNGTYTLMSLII